MLLAVSFFGALLRVVVVVVVAIVATALSLRLLGIRRGWGTALIAGGIGWTTAVLLASGLDDWDWGADGFLMRAIAIGIPATMAVAVTLDLLARPGSLAIGERAGLVVAPRPGPRGEDPDRGAPPLPRAGAAWPVARASGRSSPPPGGPSAPRRRSASACGGSWRRRAGST